jgi:hypothetical protein
MVAPPPGVSHRRFTAPILVALAFALLAPSIAGAQGVNLAWNDCGAHGSSIVTFACNTNSGPAFDAIASFVPGPGVTLTGLHAEVTVASADELPSWWHHGSGQCRGTSGLLTSFDFTTGPFECADPWLGQAAAGHVYDVGYGGPNQARLRVMGAVPMGLEAALDATTEYYAFKIRIARAKSAGVGSCPGCEAPVAITLSSIRLEQPGGASPVELTTPLLGATVHWQNTFGPTPEITAFTPPAGGAGTVVTLTGERLAHVSDVRFSGQSAAFAVVSDGEITTTAPAGVLTGYVSVQAPEGVAATPDLFIAEPAITGFTPTSAMVGAVVSVTGVNFTRATSVEINGMAAPFSVVSNVRIDASVPSGATDGPIAVTNEAGVAATSETLFVGPVSAGDGGVNLSWDDCGTAGSEVRTFACNTNSGSPFVAIASVVAPAGVDELLGMYATLEIQSAGGLLPSWWLHGSGQCRSTTGLTAGFDFTAGPGSCLDFWSGQAAGGLVYEPGFGGADRARIRVAAAVPSDHRGPIEAGSQYYMFKLNVLRTKSTGTGACAGCDVPVCIRLQEIQLVQPASVGYDPVIAHAANRNRIAWQSDTAPCPGTTPPPLDVTAPAGPRLTLDQASARGGRALAFSFTLADPGTARLEVFDASGRRHAGHVASFAAGRHDVEISASRALPSGVYFARLVHGPHVATRSFTIAR